MSKNRGAEIAEPNYNITVTCGFTEQCCHSPLVIRNVSSSFYSASYLVLYFVQGYNNGKNAGK
jgi:hypothetical protein